VGGQVTAFGNRDGRLLAGIAIAAAAMAVLIAAAPPGPAAVVAIGEPSTYTGPALRDDRDRALPACPGPAHIAAPLVTARAGATAERFIAAWAAGDAAALRALADPVFRGRAGNLSLHPGGPGAGAEMRVTGMGHDDLAAPIGERCGSAALALMRVADVRRVSTPLSVVHVYVVWRSNGPQVWALR
jgi:hypothetical protein